MLLSYYLKRYQAKNNPDSYILFSTKKTSKILISKESFHSLENGNISPSNRALLADLDMIVKCKNAEKQSVLNRLDDLNAKNTALNITVLLNLDCNFACIYCYQGDMKGNLYMSEQTAAHLVEFIKKKLDPNKQSLIVDFYGGEPLLSIDLIKSISRSLKTFAESRGAEFKFSLITNGTLLNRRTAKELVDLGLDRVKITLDGPPETHDRYRPFKTGSGSFAAIIRNIKETWDLAEIAIGGNFDRTTYSKFPALFGALDEADLTPEKISAIKFDPISSIPEANLSPTDYKKGCMSNWEPWLHEAGNYLREHILKRGYYTPKPQPLFCSIENRDAFVVNYDGDIYKCPAFIGQRDYVVGNLKTGICDYTETYRLDTWKNEDCRECEYLPLCFGGCRYMTFVRNGKIDEVDCQKAYLDANLETLIDQDITYR